VRGKGNQNFISKALKEEATWTVGCMESLRMGVDVEVEFNKRDMRVWIGELHKRGSYGQSTEFLVL
jgi:hypothetical protein